VPGTAELAPGGIGSAASWALFCALKK